MAPVTRMDFMLAHWDEPLRHGNGSREEGIDDFEFRESPESVIVSQEFPDTVSCTIRQFSTLFAFV